MAGNKILVVDDDDEIRSFVTDGLTSAGFEVISAADGVEGLEKAKAERPDLVLLDLAMPRMHGYQVCKAIREDGDLAGVKIIVTSGKSYAVDIKTAKDAGADQYVVKPYGIGDILKLVKALLP